MGSAHRHAPGAPRAQVDLGGRIDSVDLAQRHHEHFTEPADADVVAAELLLQCDPRNQLPMRLNDAMQALREPCVNIECHRGVGEGRDRSFVQRHGMRSQALEVVQRQPNGRRP
jgi:hypothetical protein